MKHILLLSLLSRQENYYYFLLRLLFYYQLSSAARLGEEDGHLLVSVFHHPVGEHVHRLEVGVGGGPGPSAGRRGDLWSRVEDQSRESLRGHPPAGGVSSRGRSPVGTGGAGVIGR